MHIGGTQGVATVVTTAADDTTSQDEVTTLDETDVPTLDAWPSDTKKIKKRKRKQFKLKQFSCILLLSFLKRLMKVEFVHL